MPGEIALAEAGRLTILSWRVAAGGLAFTCTWYGPRYWASAFVSARTPAFATRYVNPATSPVIGGVDPTRAIFPDFRALKWGRTACVTNTAPIRSSSIGPRNASSESASYGANHSSARNGWPA